MSARPPGGPRTVRGGGEFRSRAIALRSRRTCRGISVLQVNGEPTPAHRRPAHALLDALREQAGLDRHEEGCDQGACGACTVLSTAGA